MAEEVGFEPTVPCGTTVFKTAAFDHSATPPRQIFQPTSPSTPLRMTLGTGQNYENSPQGQVNISAHGESVYLGQTGRLPPTKLLNS